MINGRSQDRVDAVEAVSSATVHGVARISCTAEGCAKLLREAPDLDVFVNNLGIFDAKPFAEISDDAWGGFFEVNLLSGVRPGSSRETGGASSSCRARAGSRSPPR